LTVREIGPVRQDSDRGSRRWFQDDYFDLFVWEDRAGAPIAFQLCYERGAAEGAISWSVVEGFGHACVDGGRNVGMRSPMSPLLRPDGIPPYFRIYNRLADAAELDPTLRAFVLERLRAYRRVLFGTHRRPRRRRARGR
jgi:hypothetical protein